MHHKHLFLSAFEFPFDFRCGFETDRVIKEVAGEKLSAPQLNIFRESGAVPSAKHLASQLLFYLNPRRGAAVSCLPGVTRSAPAAPRFRFCTFRCKEPP